MSMQGEDLLVGSKTPAENALELLSGEPGACRGMFGRACA